jgi:hypothetical protein
LIVQPDVGVTHDTKTQEIGYCGMLSAFFWLNMSVALGELLQTGLQAIGANLPLFVCSLFAAIILTNTVPRILKTPWPAGTRSLALVSDVALRVFLAMSLMSLQLWTIVDLAGADPGNSRSADSSGCGLCLVCHLPLHGPQLRGGRHLFRIRRRFFKRNPNRHGKHDGCREETRPSSPRLYHRATRLWFFRGHRECDGYLPISCLAQLKPAPE